MFKTAQAQTMTVIRFIRSTFNALRGASTVVADLQAKHMPCERELRRLGISKSDFETLRLS